MAYPYVPKQKLANGARVRRPYLYGADRERFFRVPTAFSGGGCGGVVC